MESKMASLLGKIILQTAKNAMEEAAPLLVDYFMEIAADCGEHGENLQTTTVHLYSDSKAQWEAMCIVQDALTAEQIAKDIGLVIKLHNATHAELQWSGV